VALRWHQKKAAEFLLDLEGIVVDEKAKKIAEDHGMSDIFARDYESQEMLDSIPLIEANRMVQVLP